MFKRWWQDKCCVRKRQRKLTAQAIDQLAESHNISTGRVKHYREAFDVFDLNHDGKIGLDELKMSMKQLNLKPTEDEAQSFLQLYDLNEDGFISFDEFVDMMVKLETPTNPTRDKKEIFDLIDKNKDGFVSREELSEMMLLIGEELDESDIDEMMKLADQNKDGQISLDEFVAVWDTILARGKSKPSIRR